MDSQSESTGAPERPEPRTSRWTDRPFPAGPPPGNGAEWRLTLDPTPYAPGLARDGIAALAERLSADRMDDARLLVSELVTNSLLHARPTDSARPIRVLVRVLPRSVAVCVADEGAGFEPGDLVASRVGVPGHRGLELVAALADRFGIAGRRPFRVWFEIDA
jgi:anti-sigma regulatory factor (Ser/Thr protein kinase)